MTVIQDTPLRQTGRTTRMLRHVVRQARNGDRVVVVAHDAHMVDHLRSLLMRQGAVPATTKKLTIGEGWVRVVGIRWVAHETIGQTIDDFFVDNAVYDMANVFPEWLDLYKEALTCLMPCLSRTVVQGGAE